ncbi:hypothetical protein CDEST_15216 [Colletotrichum destructivum]|uniref:Uncharacterized protein n=1 Tax=Colletotrichum destructivum TaxID=34406 RepID=A0AAX4J3T4_9PEZI|nr:hypothetical protein CDEST_15216 [Colletotrichum destructivum]
MLAAPAATIRAREPPSSVTPKAGEAFSVSLMGDLSPRPGTLTCRRNSRAGRDGRLHLLNTRLRHLRPGQHRCLDPPPLAAPLLHRLGAPLQPIRPCCSERHLGRAFAGALGAVYPDTDFIVEGDTPSLLYLIPNGLSDPEYPEWGSWGSRYGPVNYGEGHYAEFVDAVRSDDGKVVMGSHLTIWRWRGAFQNDFAARMNWGVADSFARGRHPPMAVVNGDRSRDVLKMDVVAGQKIVLDASESCDPDGERLTYKWWQYLDPTSTQNKPFKTVPRLGLSGINVTKITVTIPEEKDLRKQGRNQHPEEDKHLHLILEVLNGSWLRIGGLSSPKSLQPSRRQGTMNCKKS